MPAAVPFFTKDNAKAFAIAGGKARWAKAKARPMVKPDEIPDARAREVIELCQEQIALTRTALQDSQLKPGDRAKLLVGLDRLLERERVWSQRAGPGQLRPEPTSRRQARYWEKPVVMKPVDTTGSVPGDKPAA